MESRIGVSSPTVREWLHDRNLRTVTPSQNIYYSPAISIATIIPDQYREARPHGWATDTGCSISRNPI